MRSDTIIHGNKLIEVIRDQLRHALTSEGIDASEEAEFYLVNLLNDYHQATNVSVLEEARPLGVIFLEAMAERPGIRASQLKRIGDGTLIGLGFFREIIEKSIVDRSYYLTIGGAAYDALSDVLVCDAHFAHVYAWLAKNFPGLVEALARMAPWNRASSNRELMMIYRRWLESGDEKLADLLEEEGISTEGN